MTGSPSSFSGDGSRHLHDSLPGIELDNAIARVIGFGRWPAYSVDDGAAMAAARVLVERGFAVSVFWDQTWGCSIRRLSTEERVSEMCQIHDADPAQSDPDSPALAISRAIVAADR